MEFYLIIPKLCENKRKDENRGVAIIVSRPVNCKKKNGRNLINECGKLTSTSRAILQR
jgi:hypothetical protein